MKRFLVYALSALLFGLVGSGCSEENRPVENQKVLLISVDGLMNDYIERNETPTFDSLITNGVLADRLIGVFPTKTFPNHFSQVTGLYAENHGIIANSFSDENLEGRFSFGPQESPNDERWWGGEPIWITAEKQGLTSATMFWPGSEASFNGMRPTKWKDYDGSVDDFVRIDTVLSWLDPNGTVDADFSTLYFSEVDSRGHRYGPYASEVDEEVERTDQLMNYLFDGIRKLGLENRLNVIIVSDHGMAEVSEEKVIFLDEIIDMNSVDVVDWTPAAQLRPKEGQRETVYQQLKENEENYEVFYKEDLPEGFGFTNHHRIPDIIMIADISYTITSRDFFENRGVSGGAHGYDHRHPQMGAVFLATGPGFKNGEKLRPFQSIHLYEMMTGLLGIEPAPNDGSPDSLRHILR